MLRPFFTRGALLVVSCLFGLATASEYSELLNLRPLPAASLLASFHFHSNTSRVDFDSQSFRHFPRSLVQILQHARTKELHLRFSSGRWDDENWGGRPWDGYREGGTGVELWAWVEASTAEEADARWLTLTNALSGLFCASLNFIDATRTIRPVLTFEPQGDHADASSSNLHLLHGTLPAEVVCTENLTPFLKLLPCKGKAGISSLLDGHKLFDSSWQAMSIDVQPRCTPSTQDCVVEIDQTIDMVLDIERSKRSGGDPIPRPPRIEEIDCDKSKDYSVYGDSCFPVQGPASPSFSISDVFGRPIRGACPLADETGAKPKTLCLVAVQERTVTARPAGNYAETNEGNSTCYSLQAENDFDLELAEQATLATPDDPPTLITAHRTLTGRGQQHGGFRTVFTNRSPDASVKFAYLEPVPWFMKPFLHTMQAELSLASGSRRQIDTQDVVEEVFYRPSVDRKRASHLEMVITVPAASSLTLSYDYEKSILRYTEYPPDANRGFNAASAIIRVISGPGGPSPRPTYLRTTSLLLYLPTPDFSMPYNVIILSSTVIALAFGSIFNFLVRRFVALDEVPDGTGLKSRLKNGLTRLLLKLSRQKDKTE